MVDTNEELDVNLVKVPYLREAKKQEMYALYKEGERNANNYIYNLLLLSLLLLLFLKEIFEIS